MNPKRVTKLNPTNTDLADGLNDLHDCLDEHIEKTALNFASINGKVDALLEVFHVKVDPETKEPIQQGKAKKPIAAMSPREIGWRLSSLVGVLVLAVKLVDAIWPSVMSAGHAAWQVLLNQ